MLRVTVELCPHGDDGRRRAVAHAVIGRSPGSVETADGHAYVAALWEDWMPDELRAAAVTHRQQDGIWALVAAVIAGCTDERASALAPAVLDMLRERVASALPEDVVPRLAPRGAGWGRGRPASWVPRRLGDGEDPP